jgi:hypothetical protein
VERFGELKVDSVNLITEGAGTAVEEKKRAVANESH